MPDIQSTLKLSALALLLLILSLPSMINAGEAIDYAKGFRDMEWGASLSDWENLLQKSKNKIRPFKGYDRTGENLNWEGITAKSITYGFRRGKFGGLNIGFADKDVAAVLDAFSEKFGKPKKTNLFIMTNYEWHTDDLDISLISSKKGASINIKPK